MTKPGRVRQLFDALFFVSIIAIVIYLIVDGVKDDTIEPVSTDPDPIVDSVRICSKSETKNEPNKWFEPTALDEYVWKRDGTYRYNVTVNEAVTGAGGVTRIVAKFWSQTWLPNEDWFLDNTQQKEWWHWMTIFVPDERARDFEPDLLDSAIMIVAGGGNNNKARFQSFTENKFIMNFISKALKGFRWYV